VRQNLNHISIEKLALEVAQGNEQALAKLYKLCRPSLVYYGLRIAGRQNESVVNEVIQEFFLWIAENYHKLNNIQNFEAYLYQSFRRNLQQKNLAKADKRKIKERYIKRTDPLQEKLTPSPEFHFIKEEEKSLKQIKLQKAMAQLPPYQREILHLRYFEEREYEEIASLLSISQQVARNYVYRAIQNLRKLLK